MRAVARKERREFSVTQLSLLMLAVTTVLLAVVAKSMRGVGNWQGGIHPRFQMMGRISLSTIWMTMRSANKEFNEMKGD
eukprot:scaffold1923_cov235-Ochromonas_danica.AAC.4